MSLKQKNTPYQPEGISGNETIIIYDENGRGKHMNFANLLKKIKGSLLSVVKDDDDDKSMSFFMGDVAEAFQVNASFLEGLTSNIQDQINDKSILPYGGFVPHSSGTQGSATVLTSTHNVLVVGDNGYSAKTPDITSANKWMIVNNWRNYTCILFPSEGDNFDGPFGGGTDAPITLQPYEIVYLYGVGNVGLGGQTWMVFRPVSQSVTAGVKHRAPSEDAVANAIAAVAGGILKYEYSGEATTATTGQETLETYNLVGGTLPNEEDMLIAQATFVFGPNSNNKRARIVFNAEVAGEYTSTGNGERVVITAYLSRFDGSCYGKYTVATSAGVVSAGELGIITDFDSDVTINFTGENFVASAGDVTLFDYALTLIKKTS